MNDHFLPHRAAHLVRQVVHLVKNNHAQVVKGCARIDHVAQHFGRHNDDGRTGIDRRVTGCETDVVRSEQVAQLQVFLVGKCLDGSRIERAHSLLENDICAELPNDRLARTGGCSDEDGTAGLDGIECLNLEWIRGEAER